MTTEKKITFCNTQNIERDVKKMSIDTIYNGNKFRSRLEARYAVLFDALGLEYIYEPIAARNLGGNIYYMPDFLVTMPVVFVQLTHKGEYLVNIKQKVYVEVKGEMTISDMQKIERFQATSRDFPLWVVGNIPDTSFFDLHTNDMRPKDIDEVFPYYSCGMAGWYDTGMVLCRNPRHRDTIGLSHHGIGVRLNADEGFELAGSKSWFDKDIKKAYDKARQMRFEKFIYTEEK